MTELFTLMRADREITVETTFTYWLLRREADSDTTYHIVDVSSVIGSNLDRFVGQTLEMGTNPKLWRGHHMRSLQRNLNKWGKC